MGVAILSLLVSLVLAYWSVRHEPNLSFLRKFSLGLFTFGSFSVLLFFGITLTLALALTPEMIPEERELLPLYDMHNPLSGGTIVLSEFEGKRYYYFYQKSEDGKRERARISLEENITFKQGSERKLIVYHHKKSWWYSVFSNPQYEFYIPEDYVIIEKQK